MRCQSVHLPTEPKRVGGHMFCKCVLRIHAPVTPRRMQPYTVPAIQRPMNRSQKGGRQLQLASTTRQMSYCTLVISQLEESIPGVMVPWRQRWGYIYDIVLQDKLEQTVLILVHYTK